MLPTGTKHPEKQTHLNARGSSIIRLGWHQHLLVLPVSLASTSLWLSKKHTASFAQRTPTATRIRQARFYQSGLAGLLSQSALLIRSGARADPARSRARRPHPPSATDAPRFGALARNAPLDHLSREALMSVVIHVYYECCRLVDIRGLTSQCAQV